MPDAMDHVQQLADDLAEDALKRHRSGPSYRAIALRPAGLPAADLAAAPSVGGAAVPAVPAPRGSPSRAPAHVAGAVSMARTQQKHYPRRWTPTEAGRSHLREALSLLYSADPQLPAREAEQCYSELCASRPYESKRQGDLPLVTPRPESR